MNAQETISTWPKESREAAQLVINKYGEPQEETDSLLVWHRVGPWKRVVARKEFKQHNFPAPHIDAVESVIDHAVSPDKLDELGSFDGSVTYRRTAGELSAECHDEEANFLALNLANDVINGARSVEDAREYYAKEFLGYREGKPTPYMEKLRFEPNGSGGDADVRIISEEELQNVNQ